MTLSEERLLLIKIKILESEKSAAEVIAKQAIGELATLATAIRKHRDQRGDDRCWMDDVELYQTLPEGYTPPARDSTVELKLCEKFIACRHNPGTEYVSPQRRIEDLENMLREIVDGDGYPNEWGDRAVDGDIIKRARELLK